MDVNIKGAGPNTSIEAQVDPTYAAMRFSQRPIEYAATGAILGGHFAIATMTGLMAAGIATGAQVFQVRWVDPTGKFFLLKRFFIQCSTATGFAATTVGAPLELIIGHGASANGTGGGTVAPNSISNRMRQGMNTSAFASAGEIRIATTAALGAATGQALEPAAIASCMGADNRTLVSTPIMTLFDASAGNHPLFLNSGDTLVVRTVSPAATGTWFMSATMEWVETVVY